MRSSKSVEKYRFEPRSVPVGSRRWLQRGISVRVASRNPKHPVSSAWAITRACHSPVMFLQQRDHVGVRKLPKFRVMRSDSEKRPRGAQANDLSDLLSQFLERVLGCDRDREDDFPCSGPSDSAKRGAYRAAGSDPVIDDDDRPAGERHGRPVTKINLAAPLDLFQLAHSFAPDVVLVYGELRGEDVVDDHLWIGSVHDRTEREFGQ